MMLWRALLILGSTMTSSAFDPLPSKTVFRISQGLDLVLLSDDEVLVQFGTRSHPSELFRDSDMTGVLARTIGRLLQGPATLDDLIAAAGESHANDVAEFVNHLFDRGFLSSAEQDPVEQYLRYSFDGATALGEQSVALFGCGPLGARIAEGLVQHGVGSIVLVDDRKTDVLWEKSAPLNWTTGEELKSAAAAVAEALSSNGSKVERVSGQTNAVMVDDVITKTGFAIMAMEQVDLRLGHLINRFAIRRRKPWLHVAIDGNFAVVGPLFEPPYTACYNDFRTLATAATPSADMMNRYRRHILERPASSFFPGLPAYAEIAAGYAVLAAVHRLLGRPSFASGRAMMINFEQFQIDVEEVLRLPRCPVCGSQKTIPRPVSPPDFASGHQSK